MNRRTSAVSIPHVTAAGTVISDARIEQPINGLTIEWLREGRIVVFTPTVNTIQVMKVMFDCATEIVATWPADRVCLTMQNFARHEMTATPYMRGRASSLMRMRPEMPWYAATVLTRSIPARIFQIAARLYRPGNHQLQVFFGRAEAMRWLEGILR